MSGPVEGKMREASWVPWDRPGEWAIWLLALIIATIFIHNFTQWAFAKLPAHHGGEA